MNKGDGLRVCPIDLSNTGWVQKQANKSHVLSTKSVKLFVTATSMSEIKVGKHIDVAAHSMRYNLKHHTNHKGDSGMKNWTAWEGKGIRQDVLQVIRPSKMIATIIRCSHISDKPTSIPPPTGHVLSISWISVASFSVSAGPCRGTRSRLLWLMISPHKQQSVTAKLGLNNTIQYNTIQYNTIQYNTLQWRQIHGISWYQTPCMQSEMELWLQDQKNIYSGWGCLFLSIEPIGRTESRYSSRVSLTQAAGWKDIFPNYLAPHRGEMAWWRWRLSKWRANTW